MIVLLFVNFINQTNEKKTFKSFAPLSSGTYTIWTRKLDLPIQIRPSNSSEQCNNRRGPKILTILNSLQNATTVDKRIYRQKKTNRTKKINAKRQNQASHITKKKLWICWCILQWCINLLCVVFNNWKTYALNQLMWSNRFLLDFIQEDWGLNLIVDGFAYCSLNL